MGPESPAVIMFARERFCPDVTRSRLRLADLGIPWTEIDFEADDAAGAEVERLTGRSYVPTFVIGNQILVEPSNSLLDEALIAAGYDLSEEEVAV